MLPTGKHWTRITTGNLTGPVTTPLRQAGPGNSDDLAVSHVRERPAPVRAALPKIAAFHTDMPTILLPTALLFVCIDSRATTERRTNLSDNVMSERLPRSRQQFFLFSFSFFTSKFLRNFQRKKKISRSYTILKYSKIFSISLSENGEISPGKKTSVHIPIAMISLCIHFFPQIETAPIFQPMWCLKSSWRVPAAMATVQPQAVGHHAPRLTLQQLYKLLIESITLQS